MGTVQRFTKSANGNDCTHGRTYELEIARCKTLLSVEGIANVHRCSSRASFRTVFDRKEQCSSRVVWQRDRKSRTEKESTIYSDAHCKFVVASRWCKRSSFRRDRYELPVRKVGMDTGNSQRGVMRVTIEVVHLARSKGAILVVMGSTGWS